MHAMIWFRSVLAHRSLPKSTIEQGEGSERAISVGGWLGPTVRSTGNIMTIVKSRLGDSQVDSQKPEA